MEIKKHIVFCDDEEPELIQYLQNNNIKYRVGEIISTVDIYESSPHWAYIGKYAEKRDISCLSDTVFSKRELEEAEWLSVRSKWHFEYPQPIDDNLYQTITYSVDHHCKACGQSLEQVRPFRVKKAPKWTNRHFLMLNWIADELFIEENTKRLLEKEFPFLSYCEVHNKNGTEVFEDFYQIVIPVLSEAGIIENQRCIGEVLVCPDCGKKKYHPNGEGMLQMKRKIFEGAPDMVKSIEMFGWGCGADRVIFISQKMYRFIVSNQLERALEFAPIDLID